MSSTDRQGPSVGDVPVTLRPDADYVVGIHDFEGRTDDELSLRKGDYIEVIETDQAFGDGWYVGHNTRTQQAGLFPKIFTTGAISPKSPTRKSSVATSTASIRRVSRDHHLPQDLQNVREANNDIVVQPYRATVHDTLTDIDAAILEFNAPSTGSAGSAPNNHKNNNHNPQSPGAAVALSSGHTYSSRSPSENASTAVGGGTSYSNNSPMTPGPVHHNSQSPASTVRSPGSMNFPPDFDYNNVADWSPLEVRRYLLACGYDAEVAGCFAEHKITGSIFMELDMPALREIGIVTFGPRFEISKEIKKLNSLVASQKRDSETFYTPASAASSIPHSGSQGQLLPAASITPRSTSLQQIRLVSDDSHPSSGHSPNANIQANTNSNADFDHKRTSSFNRDWMHPVKSTNGYVREGSPAQLGSSESSYVSLASGQHQYTDSRQSHLNGSDHSRNASKDTVVGSNQKSNSLYSHTLRNRTRSVSDFKDHAGNSLSAAEKEHRRHSSIMSFMRNDEHIDTTLTNPATASAKGANSTPPQNSTKSRSFLGLTKSPTTKRVNTAPSESSTKNSADTKQRAASGNAGSAPKKLTKQQTSAFTEGIRRTTAAQATKNAEFAGWMNKKGGGTGMGTWKHRYFVLEGTRLSYFSSFDDDKEKGLIDITGHRVLPAKENEDKFVSLYAASMRAGKFCFKLVPPAPGFRKGITFTAPKVHYFAVDSKGEMKAWMAALMKATIDRDDTVPVESTFSSPTISLSKAQELFKEGRERDEDLRAKMVAEGLINQRNSGNKSSPLATSSPVFPISTPIPQSGSQSGLHSNSNSSSSHPRSSSATRKPVNGYPSTPDSPTGSSMDSSRTGSSATNNSSVKALQTYSPADVYQNYTVPGAGNHHDDRSEDQIASKTANLTIVTEYGHLE